MAERRMTRIKICGITTKEDAIMVCECGIDAVGFVFAPSRRHVEPEKAAEIIEHIPPFVTTVGIFMDKPLEDVRDVIAVTGIDVVQLHGNEPPQYCREIPRRVIKRIPVTRKDTTRTICQRMREYKRVVFLLDPGAGDGAAFDWNIARTIKRPFIVAGGLTPSNVRAVVRILSPHGVDVSSGVEDAPGVKNRRKIAAFVKEVRRCC